MRVVSLSPSFTEIVVRLGAESGLVGISDHCPEIKNAVRVGSPKALKLSEIDSLKPEIIFSDQHETRPEEIREIRKKYPVTEFFVRSVDDAAGAVLTIGRLLRKEAAAAQLAEEIQTAQSESRKLFAGLPPVPALILLWDPPYLTVNFDTYASRLVEGAGGWNVFHADPLPEFPVDLEDMIEKNPEIVILPKDPYPFTKRHIAKLKQFRVFSKIPMELINGKWFSVFGPRTVEAITGLRDIMLRIRKAAYAG